jgi:hypothetical protein
MPVPHGELALLRPPLTRREASWRFRPDGKTNATIAGYDNAVQLWGITT